MSWLRRNRWWLLVLPVTLAVVVVASAYNVKVFWYDSGLHHAMAVAEPGEFVEVTDDYTDPYGDTSRTLRVRLRGLGPTPTYPVFDGQALPPSGTEATMLALEFEADPEQTLNYCRVTVEDTEGRRYELPDDSTQVTPCLLDGLEGPVLPIDRSTPRGFVPDGQDRPPTWRSWPIFLLPEGTQVARVLVWWDRPDYVELPAP